MAAAVLLIYALLMQCRRICGGIATIKRFFVGKRISRWTRAKERFGTQVPVQHRNDAQQPRVGARTWITRVRKIGPMLRTAQRLGFRGLRLRDVRAGMRRRLLPAHVRSVSGAAVRIQARRRSEDRPYLDQRGAGADNRYEHARAIVGSRQECSGGLAGQGRRQRARRRMANRSEALQEALAAAEIAH